MPRVPQSEIFLAPEQICVLMVINFQVIVSRGYSDLQPAPEFVKHWDCRRAHPVNQLLIFNTDPGLFGGDLFVIRGFLTRE
jgi:hypothetical protein